MDFSFDAAKLRRLEIATNLGCQYFLQRDKTSHAQGLNQRLFLFMTDPTLSDANVWLGPVLSFRTRKQVSGMYLSKWNCTLRSPLFRLLFNHFIWSLQWNLDIKN